MTDVKNEEKKVENVEQMTDIEKALSLYKKTKATKDEIQAQHTKENQRFEKIPMFLIDKEGTFEARILPLKPDGEEVRVGWTYPIHETWLSITRSNGTSRKHRVIRPDYAGIDGDLLMMYVNEAKKIAEDTKNDELQADLEDWRNGMYYRARELAYVLNVNERAKGVHLYNMSKSQYNDIHSLHMDLWGQLIDSVDKNAECPFTAMENAYLLRITRSKEEGQTKYKFRQSLQNNDSLTQEEILAWYNTPSIPEMQYVYNRYMFTGVVCFLEQFDAKWELGICDTEAYLELKAKVEEQLDPNDTSTFEVDGSSSDDEEEGGSLNLDDLFDEFDAIADKEADSEEAANLRTKIAEFIEQEGLDVRVSIRKTNEDLLADIKSALEAPKEKTTGRRKSRR